MLLTSPENEERVGAVWRPYIELFHLVNDVILNKNIARLSELESALRKHKTSFISLLKNPPRSDKDRELLKRAPTDGVVIGGSAAQKVSQACVDETLILADLFELNELAALQLLFAGEAHMSHYPGLTRGLTAVLLYYDGRRALACAFKTLVQARRGVAWNCGLPDSVTDMITGYVDDILDENMLNKILDLLGTMSWQRELSLLDSASALASRRHLRQLSDLFAQCRQALANTLFCWLTQSAATTEQVSRLLHYVATMEPAGVDGQLDCVQLSVVMALLHAICPLRVLRAPDVQEQIAAWPLLNCVDFLELVHRNLMTPSTQSTTSHTGGQHGWKCASLLSVVQLVWALSLVSLRRVAHLTAEAAVGMLEDDEMLLDRAIVGDVFVNMANLVVDGDTFFDEEFYVRFVHDIVSELLVSMPLKIKELRSRAEDTARTIHMYQQEGLEPPANLPRHFEHLLHLLSRLYSDDRLKLGLALHYWNTDTNSHRQMSLYKFVRGAGETVPAALYVPYVQLMCSLAGGCATCATHCYTLLTTSGNLTYGNLTSGNLTYGNLTSGGLTYGGGVSLARIFSALHAYHNVLQQHVSTGISGVVGGISIYPSKQLPLHELNSLLASLRLISVIAERDPSCRLAICDKAGWSAAAAVAVTAGTPASPPLTTLFLSLLRLAVPVPIKAQLLDTLASLAASADVAAPLWHQLEAAQLLQTQPSAQPPRGIQMELEEVEARAEQYPLTCAFVRLLTTLVRASMPTGLGAGTRAAGLTPYLNFVELDVLLNFATRAYRRPAEQYEVGCECVRFLLAVVELWDESSASGGGGGGGVSSQQSPREQHPGLTVLLHMMQDSKLLRLVLNVLSDGVFVLDGYGDEMSGSSASEGRDSSTGSLSQLTLLCLRLLRVCLQRQQLVLDWLRQSADSAAAAAVAPQLLAGLDQQLLASSAARASDTSSAVVSARANDFVLVLVKYLSYGAWLAEHSREAADVLAFVCSRVGCQQQLCAIMSRDTHTGRMCMAAFVDCLEVRVPEDDACAVHQCRVSVLRLLLNTLHMPGRTVAHLLLLGSVSFSGGGVVVGDVCGTARNCLCAIVDVLSEGLTVMTRPRITITCPTVANMAYQVVYLLCASPLTSCVTLRLLRSSYDFICGQLRPLPATDVRQDATDADSVDRRLHALQHASWLLKLAAIELKTTSSCQLRSHLSRLVHLLMDSWSTGAPVSSTMTTSSVVSGAIALEALGVDASTLSLATPSANLDGASGGGRCKLTAFLDAIQVSRQPPQQPDWEYFDPDQIFKVMRQCQHLTTTTGASPLSPVRQIDVRRMQALLTAELAALHGTAAVAQRQHIAAEVRTVLAYCTALNEHAAWLHHSSACVDGVRQLFELLVTAVSPSQLTVSQQPPSQLLVNITRHVLNKVLSATGAVELSAPLCGTLLLLMNAVSTASATDDADASGGGRLPAGAAVLRTLAECLQVRWTSASVMQQPTSAGSGGGGGRAISQQRIRANLYGALLHLLRPMTHTDAAGDGSNSSSSNRDRHGQAADVLRQMGHHLLDTVCRDATSGHHVCRILAMCSLDAMLQLNGAVVVDRLIGSGFVAELCDSVASGVTSAAADQRYLFVYDAQMALLCRVVSGGEGRGARAVLRTRLLFALGELRVLDAWNGPATTAGAGAEEARVRCSQLLLPALRLCAQLLAALAAVDRTASAQVMNFLGCHMQLVGELLSHDPTTVDSHTLQACCLLASVLSLTVVQHDDSMTDGPSGVTSSAVGGGQLHRFRQLVSAQLARYLSWSPAAEHLDATTDNAASTTDDVLQPLTSDNCRLQTLCQLLTYYQSLVTSTGVELLFVVWPADVQGALVSSNAGGGGGFYALMIAALHTHRRSLAAGCRRLDRLQQQLSAVDQLGVDASALHHGRMTSQQLRARTADKLRRLMRLISTQVSMERHVVDVLLLLVWTQLDYVCRCCPMTTLRHNITTTTSSQFPHVISAADQADLKKHMCSLVSDSLLDELTVSLKDPRTGEQHYSFSEAMIRRIRRLVKFNAN